MYPNEVISSLKTLLDCVEPMGKEDTKIVGCRSDSVEFVIITAIDLIKEIIYSNNDIIN